MSIYTHSEVDVLGVWYNSVNIGAKKDPAARPPMDIYTYIIYIYIYIYIYR